ncbi:MAG: hypothetical protein HC927_14190 [Deltaproteobacteria bacterium]|nr:hypothetical protein [Deltaproteobacteria bacterium]
MELRKAITLGLALTAGMLLVTKSESADADEQYQHFCSTVPSACPKIGPDAPVLRANVCWNGTNATLEGSGCAAGTYPFYVDFGTVDPLSGVVQAYVSLPDACALGYCTVLAPSQMPPTDEGVVCCDPSDGTCTLDVEDCLGEVLYCDDYETNGDGTVDCLDPEG